MSGSFKDHFSARSADYARFRPRYPPGLVDYLAELAPGRALALDCGCGAGQLSVPLAGAFRQVVATDASPQQIASAAPHPTVRYAARRADDSGLDDHSVDLVTVAQAAHWLDLDAFYREVRRVLRPGGIIALITYGVIEADDPVGPVLADFHHRVIGSYWPPERRHVETGYRLLPFPFTEQTPPPLAMTARWPLADLLGYVDTWSAMRAGEAALGRAPFTRFAADLAAVWGDPAQSREIRWPLSLRVGW